MQNDDMKRRLSIWFVFVATCLLVVHAVVPHHHHNKYLAESEYLVAKTKCSPSARIIVCILSEGVASSTHGYSTQSLSATKHTLGTTGI